MEQTMEASSPHRSPPPLDDVSIAVLEQLPVALVAADRKGGPFWWNEQAYLLLGEDIAVSSLKALQARIHDQKERLNAHTAAGTAADGSPLTWLVVVEADADDDVLEAFAHQALHDHLTGLPNRTLLNDRIQLALGRTERTGRAVVVAFLDLDHFKLINDTQGHAEGDELLRVVADRLRDTVRPGDTVARFGGDEFVVVCEGVADRNGAMELADRLRQVIEEPLKLRGEEVFVSASLGIALGLSTDTPEALLRDADAAMYQAKLDGRARAQLFDDAIRWRVEERRETERALRLALEENQFELAYQPIVALEAGWVVGAEALVRWRHPERGIVMPADFIGVAEETSLILPLGEWVLDEACRQLRQWRIDVPHVPLFMSVNVSGRQLRSSVLDAVSRITKLHSVDPKTLVLEITEGVLMENLTRCKAALEELKSVGVRLAIDDFGVGYSSLSYLKHLPIEIIKIDQSFISGLGVDANDSAIVSAIIGMARALKVGVVAEGVETPDQLYALRHLGCPYAQGFRFARPLPPEQFAALLAERHRW